MSTVETSMMCTGSLAAVFHPAALIALCVLAGVGTVLLLPGKREGAIRKIGGAVLAGVLFIFVAMLLRHSAARSAGDVYFWIFSILAIFSALRVVSHPRPVYSALYFVLTVLASAGLFILLWAEFMAAALVLIYAGAILVTYVFVIMLASQAQSGTTGESGEAVGAEYDRVSREPLLASVAGFTLMGVVLFLIFEKPEDLKPVPGPVAGAVATAPQPAGDVPVITAPQAGVPAVDRHDGEVSGIRQLGTYLFREQLLTLELAGLILTLGMVGAVVIARRHVQEPAAETLPTAGPAGRTTEAALPGPDDNPHSIPVYGTTNPQHKAYPEA